MNGSATEHQGELVCQLFKELRSGGIFYGDSPFDFATSMLFFQLSLSALMTAFLQYILTPLGESAFISQMLAGIVLGPSFIGQDSTFSKMVFPVRSLYISQTVAFFGCMLFMFLVGVKVDLSLVTSSGKKALAVGLCSLSVPIILSTGLALILQRTVTMEPFLNKSLITIAIFQSSNSFYVTACLLADLKLLNSELGRLALSSSLISGLFSWIGLIFLFTVEQSTLAKANSLPWMALCLGSLVIFVVYILRPIMLWMVSQTARDKSIKEAYVFSIFIMVLVCALFGEYIGQHFMLGPMILGLAVPDGPPLGSALVDKLESFVSSVLLPTYFVFSGAGTNVFLIQMKSFGVTELMVLCGFLGKVLGAMLPTLFCKMPVVDSLSLGLILSAQGITDILMWQHGMMLFLIDKQSYTIMVLSTVVLTGTITPLVKVLYNPSKRYMSRRRRRTIEHALPNAELRLLTCIYNQENTPSIIKLLQLSNPSLKSPICFYFIHLIQLSGRSTPLLVSHRPGKPNSVRSQYSDHIINAFQLFEQQNNGKAIMNAYTAIAPCATMHDDVCTLALEKRTSMVIVPFHRQWTSNTNDWQELSTCMVRSVNLNILEKAPCSVGLLVDGGTLSGSISECGETFYDIGMIFIQGPDDREALAYAMRMAENPNVSLTVVRLLDHSKARRTTLDTELDNEMMNKYKIFKASRKRHVYMQEAVENNVEMINVIRSMDIPYDLILVGRRHDEESPLFMGTDWNENPELGFIGDMLTSSDINCDVSVLVVQQQSLGRHERMAASYVVMEQVCTVDIPRDLGKVWPV